MNGCTYRIFTEVSWDTNDITSWQRTQVLHFSQSVALDLLDMHHVCFRASLKWRKNYQLSPALGSRDTVFDS